MKNKRIHSIVLAGFLVLPLFFTGCQQRERKQATSISTSATTNLLSPLSFRVDAETFSLWILKGEASIPVSMPQTSREVSSFSQTENTASWVYPKEQISVLVTAKTDHLSVTITSDTDQDNSFTWPSILGETYYLPLGEGKQIPANHPDWHSFLTGNELDTIEQLSMPFWTSINGDYGITYILEDPVRSSLVFFPQAPIRFGLTSQYPAIDSEKEKTYRIYLGDTSPVTGAKQYRQYVKEQGNFLTLEEKSSQNPNVEKLYGAPFIYLWGEHVISPEDVNWQALIASLGKENNLLYTLSNETETGSQALSVLEEMKTQDYVSQYQKQAICRYLSELIKQGKFNMAQASDTPSKQLEANKQALEAALPGVFSPASMWMDGETTGLLTDMWQSGIRRAWIGLNSWEQAYQKPQLTKTAMEQGYLIAPYDSYHSIHQPGAAQWITADFPDENLYQQATIQKQNKEMEKGFQQVGRKLNPTLSLPLVQNRLEQILSNPVTFNSWFIDCDATGEVYDDYSPLHLTTKQQDLAARLERMSYIRDQYQMVIGSEGGHDFAASTIAFAHGIELPSFSWRDEDMKTNVDSPYFIGKYYNPSGGVPPRFSTPVPVKELYQTIFLDPAYDVPLYKLIYNDSVITTYHWDWSTLKISDASKDRMLREILYNVPPLYHLDRQQWQQYKEVICTHTAVWSEFSQRAILEEMTDFQYLNQDHTVQMTRYGDQLQVIANYGDSAFQVDGITLQPHSLVILVDGVAQFYTPPDLS